MATSQLTTVYLARPRLRLAGVPVLTYHGLANSEPVGAPSRERKYWIRVAEFEDHLGQILENGYRVRQLGELWDAGDTPDGARSVVLTFDDGRVSDYEIAYPLLVEAGMRASFFVNTATIGKEGFLSWVQIAEMQRSGMSFQSHSHDHVYLTWLPRRDLERQLGDSKRTLEDRVGQSVDFLSAPYGDLSTRVLEVARQVGYRAVCNSRSWPARPGTLLVNRVVLYRHTTGRAFRQLLTGSPARYLARAARDTLRYFPKRLLLRFRPSPPPTGYLASAGEQ